MCAGICTCLRGRVLRLERIVYFEGDVPMESVDGFLHGQLYKHYSEMHRAPGSGWG
jgi:hypothetical protein